MAGSVGQGHRKAIFVEDAQVLSQQRFEGEQYLLRVQAPRCAAAATPGSFAHLQCHELLSMRRPLSIMRVSAGEGWVDFLYKAVGHGTRLLSRRTPPQRINLLGPIGRGFTPDPQRQHPLLIGGGVGIPPILFLAQTMADNGFVHRPIVMMGSEVPPPFPTARSRFDIAGLPNGVNAAAELLEACGVPSRLASLRGYTGFHHGYVTDLARAWLRSLQPAGLRQIELFACGPQPMLRAVATLAAEFHVPCQVSLEEFMACAVGGCAGCTVAVREPGGVAMRRVCVDGPVFDVRGVFPEACESRP